MNIPVEHDLAEQHVFEGHNCLGAVDRIITLKCLIEVGESRLKVFLFSCMKDACHVTETTHQVTTNRTTC